MALVLALRQCVAVNSSLRWDTVDVDEDDGLREFKFSNKYYFINNFSLSFLRVLSYTDIISIQIYKTIKNIWE